LLFTVTKRHGWCVYHDSGIFMKGKGGGTRATGYHPGF
jgi:hypothetical protein